MNVFFCDLMDTFDSSEEENRDELLKKFVSLLTEICDKLNIDDLVFRFITTNHMDELIPYINELQKYTVGTPIRLTSQFSSHHKYKNGQIEKIPDDNKLDQMRHISENRGVKRIFYADDTLMNQYMAIRVMEKACPGTEIFSFIPNCDKVSDNNIYYSNKRGLSGLIEALEEYQNELNMNMEVSKVLQKRR